MKVLIIGAGAAGKTVAVHSACESAYAAVEAMLIEYNSPLS